MLEDETAGGAGSDDDDAFASGGLMVCRPFSQPLTNPCKAASLIQSVPDLSQSAMRATKDRKKPKKSKQQHLSDDDEPAPAPAAAQQASLDDEWPEDDVKPKKGKKDKKKKGGATRMDRDEDDEGAPDADKMDADEAPQPAPAQVANIEDEWPEDDVKPKKGKKDKKKKGGAAKKDEDEEDQIAPDADKMDVDDAPQPAAAPVADIDGEWPEDDVKPKKGKKGKKDEVAATETAGPAEGSVADADETQEGEVKVGVEGDRNRRMFT
jgi:translation initiation factor 5B